MGALLRPGAVSRSPGSGPALGGQCPASWRPEECPENVPAYRGPAESRLEGIFSGGKGWLPGALSVADMAPPRLGFSLLWSLWGQEPRWTSLMPRRAPGS